MEAKPKKTKEKILLFLVLLTLIGLYFVFDHIFPKASKHFEFIRTLSNHQVSYGGDPVHLSQAEFQALLDGLYEAKPTRKGSHSDHPQVNSYYQIDFDSDVDGIYPRLYLYEYGGEVYFEIPYGGIYKTNHNTLALLENKSLSE